MRGLLAAALVALALVSSSVAGAEEVSEEAKRNFEVGVQLLDDPAGPRYREAYDAFRRAFAATPSPRILGNLGLCAMALERDGEALDAYARYLEEVDDIGPDERKRIERDLVTLRSRSATLVVPALHPGTLVDRRIRPSGSPVVNRYDMGTEALTLTVHSGRHELSVETASGTTTPVRLEVRAGTQATVTWPAPQAAGPAPAGPAPAGPAPAGPAPAPGAPAAVGPPPAAMPRPIGIGDDEGGGGLSTETIVLLVGTGAVTATAIGLGAGALHAQANYQASIDSGRRGDAVDWREHGELLNGVADGFIAGSVVLGGVALGLLIRDLASDGPGSASLWVTPTGAGARATVSF